MPDGTILECVRAAAAKRMLFLPHAIKSMARPTPMISPAEVEAVLLSGDVIEDNPDRRRSWPQLPDAWYP